MDGLPLAVADAAADRTGDERANPAFQAVHPISSLVSRENLVAAVTREGHRDLLARCLGDVVRGQGGRVGEGLVEVPDEPGQVVHGVGTDQDLVVAAAHALGDQAGMLR